MSISSCPGLQSSQELADCAADPAEPCKCCSHQLECTGAIVLIIFAFLSAPFHLKIVVGLNCRRHCNTITPCDRPVWTYNCCLPRPWCVTFWCICQVWGGMGAMCTTCSPIFFPAINWWVSWLGCQSDVNCFQLELWPWSSCARLI
jgi:hypothetical protein